MILDQLAWSTKLRVEEAKKQISFEDMKRKALSMDPPSVALFPFESALAVEEMSFICEVKKASPSKGLISRDFQYLEIAKEYESMGAAAVSVLTEPEFFQGSNQYLTEISKNVEIPVLRKDFIMDEYQIYEAKVIGADAVLLICALLEAEDLKRYIHLCGRLGLSALVEAHTKEEVLQAIDAGARTIGVNNRNLKTFEVDIDNCINLRGLVPKGILFIAESGIKTREDIKILRKAGVDAVLIGETFMRCSNKKEMFEYLAGI